MEPRERQTKIVRSNCRWHLAQKRRKYRENSREPTKPGIWLSWYLLRGASANVKPTMTALKVVGNK